jgi:HlyD family secretion protein
MKLPVVLLSLAGVGAVAWLLVASLRGGSGEDSVTPAEAIYNVKRGSFAITLRENGTLVAKESQKISTGTDSGGKLTFLVEEGKSVEQGEVLARLDTKELETDQQQIHLDIVQAEANLANSRNELEIQKADNAAAIEKAQITLDKAEKDLEKYRDGEAPGERRKLDVEIKNAETEHSRMKKKAEDSDVLYKQDYISHSQLEEDQISWQASIVKLESAQRALALFEKYTQPMTMTDKETAVRDATRERGNADLRADSALRQKEVNVEQNEKRLKRLQDRLEKNQTEIEKMTVKAPSPGIVLYGDPDQPWARENIRLGGEIWGSMMLFTLPDLRIMQVKLAVHEADVNKLAMGQSAKVTMDTYPGVTLDGEVAKIASIAGSGNPWDRDPEVKKFDVSVTLKDTGEMKLKPGVSAKAEIFVDDRKDVIFVPLQCVFPREGKSWAWIVNGGGQPEAREVKTGASNDQFVEVTEGLREGERILLYNPSLPRGETDEGQDEQAADPAAEPASATPAATAGASP